MRRFVRIALGLGALALGWWLCSPVLSQGPTVPGVTGTPPAAAVVPTPVKKFEDFDKVIAGAKEHDGLFKLYQKDENLYAEIRHDQLGKGFLCPIAIAKGAGMGGSTLNFDEQWVLLFKRVGDKVHLVRRNVRFQARKGSPAAKAVETTYTDSVLLSLPIRALHPIRQSVAGPLRPLLRQVGQGHALCAVR